ncbi:MAG: plastocyanin/azurin family copper-binding protein [Thermoproteota archaeon]
MKQSHILILILVLITITGIILSVNRNEVNKDSTTEVDIVEIGDFVIIDSGEPIVLLEDEKESYRLKIKSLDEFESNVKLRINNPVRGIKIDFDKSQYHIPKNGETEITIILENYDHYGLGVHNVTLVAESNSNKHAIVKTLDVIAKGDVIIEIEGYEFHPNILTIKKGVSITWINKDDVIHTVTETDLYFRSGNIGAQSAFRQEFTELGTYGYYCEPHTYMLGKITVIE